MDRSRPATPSAAPLPHASPSSSHWSAPPPPQPGMITFASGIRSSRELQTSGGQETASKRDHSRSDVGAVAGAVVGVEGAGDGRAGAVLLGVDQAVDLALHDLDPRNVRQQELALLAGGGHHERPAA